MNIGTAGVLALVEEHGELPPSKESNLRHTGRRERLGEQFAQFTVEVETAPPHTVKQFQFQVLPRPAEFAVRHLSEGELVTSLRKRLENLVAVDLFSGAVLVAKDGKTVFAQAYGLADREKKTPNTLKTRFRLGSMNKMFTAVATLQLVQTGKLDLKAPLGTDLTDYKNKDVASKVTIEQLLSHTGARATSLVRSSIHIDSS